MVWVRMPLRHGWNHGWVIAFQRPAAVLWICTGCFDGVWQDDVWSSSLHSWVCLGASRCGIVPGILNLSAIEISCPLLSCVWAVLCHLWSPLPLSCLFVEEWQVVCGPVHGGWCKWILPPRPWCTIRQVQLPWQMPWHVWWCGQYLKWLNCLEGFLHWKNGKNSHQHGCVCHVCWDNWHRCVRQGPCHWHWRWGLHHLGRQSSLGVALSAGVSP